MNLPKTLQGSHIDEGILIHELTHVIQPYSGGVPDWLSEGIADYTRWVRYEPHNWGSGSLGERATRMDTGGRPTSSRGWSGITTENWCR